MSLFHGHYSGGPVFIKLYEEFRLIYLILESTLPSKNDLSDDTLLHRDSAAIAVSYELLFLGFDSFNIKNVKEKNELGEDFDNFLQPFEELRQEYEEDWVRNEKSIQSMLEDPLTKKINHKSQTYIHKLPFRPLDGHLSRLGHYFRHIYQILKFVDGSDLKPDEKYEFCKAFRAQLSTHEQALLYFNSFWGPGKKMWSDQTFSGSTHHFILDFKLIKNLPFHVTEFTLSPREKFLFELKKAYQGRSEEWYLDRLTTAFEELED